MSVDPGDFEGCADRLQAIAHPARLRILACLLEQRATAHELAGQLDSDAPTIEHQLNALVASGIVQREGQVYSLCTEVSLAWLGLGDDSTIDFGCCKLKLVQIQSPDDRPRSDC